MKRLIYLLLAFTLIMGCSKEEPFPYKQGLSAYMKDFFQEDLDQVDDNTLVFVYLEYCRSCVKDALVFLDAVQSPDDKLKLYLIGDPNFYPENESVLGEIKDKFNFAKDVDSNHYSYITGIGEPLIVKVEKGEVKKFSYINSDSMERAKALVNFY